MRFHHQISYDAPASAVYAMLIDPAFQTERAKAGNPVRSEATVTPGADGEAVITVTRLMAVDLPGMIQRLTGEKIDIVETQTWHGAGDGAQQREGILRAGLAGHSGGVEGTLRLDGTGAGTTITVDAEVKVNLPLVGGRIESFIAEMLTKFMTSEQEVGRAWLSGSAEVRG